MDNGFQYIDSTNTIDNQNETIESVNNTNANEIKVDENIVNDISLPDWDLLPPFDEVERSDIQ